MDYHEDDVDPKGIIHHEVHITPEGMDAGTWAKKLREQYEGAGHKVVRILYSPIAPVNYDWYSDHRQKWTHALSVDYVKGGK